MICELYSKSKLPGGICGFVGGLGAGFGTALTGTGFFAISDKSSFLGGGGVLLYKPCEGVNYEATGSERLGKA